MTPVDEQQVRELVDRVGRKSTYRSMQIPVDTLRDLAQKALERQPSTRMALKTVRRKLHQITAPYLGDPDYQKATSDLRMAFQAGDPAGIQNCCSGIMASHASTRERLQILGEFYYHLFDTYGKPARLLDLACGLNPLSWRWMGLPAGTCYRAYDIHSPRVAFLNEYFRLEGIAAEAILRDILVAPPAEEADAAFLFKEAHRFEEREAGCNRALWCALKVRLLYISLPPFSLTGRHDLTAKNRKLVAESVAGEDWRVSEMNFSNEQVFVVEK